MRRSRLRLQSVLYLGLIVRVALILYAEFHDRFFEVKYTDIDYTVFTDAAFHVLNGGSPFHRAEYRYTPLVSYLVLPNHLLHPSFGKWLFAACDLIVALFVYELTESKALGPVAVALWLFNPFTATISTRGSMESAYLLTLFASMVLLKRRHFNSAAFFFGLAVHWRLYPIVYIVPILLHIYYSEPERRRATKSVSIPGNVDLPLSWPAFVHVALFSLISGSTFVLLSVGFYRLYGQQYLDEYLFYHAARQDPKHNFSPYFYPLQLAARSPSVAHWTSLAAGLAFVPQMASCFLLGLRFFRSLPFAFLLQTIAFVAFNKVCTAQYFVWYLVLVPICLPMLRPTRFLLKTSVGWVAAVLHWLFWAYLLEFRHLPVAPAVWAASVLFLGAHMALLVGLVQARKEKVG